MRENKGYEDRGRMSIATPFQGSLFVNDFLCESVTESPDWQAIDVSTLATLEASARDDFRTASRSSKTRLMRARPKTI